MTGRPTALVTGGSRGIGFAIARRLAEAGHDLIVCARRAETMADAERSLSATGVWVHAVQADLAVEEDVRRLIQVCQDRCDRLDVLVLGAGIGAAGPVEELPLRRFDKLFAVNVRAPYALVQALLPLLRKGAAENPRHGAKIVALASITGVYPEPGLAAYGASKAALGALCRSVNAEASAAGVSATVISPGYVDTDMTQGVHDEVEPAAMISTADVAELAMSVTRLSVNAVVPEIVVTRPGGQLHRA
ncbi:Rhamnolipids biosynthesis 3-oxoacyl-[acyl-carrier-protein] reductase [Nonomuraea coxensis DSM 45129]|uniref:Rhamnolipids biosynthesis 3-oxoacyl-[acyl-carrier-protein] reductase n=1 Tax=Nonomuraea coxensis DSM 45129 TaxID=1122611 RepID=A0ABX8UDL4_9ACTN|nr:SDR family oxidoreductase [Nonomuraea coxensis]QYC45813.1 Rhamnolipids biosynthesis 3-oxoacyl-[acyl-carrier-protein] reductase [Nonomuraea coxensis DSM 45129]